MNRGAENQPSYDVFSTPLVTVRSAGGGGPTQLPASGLGLAFLKAGSANTGTITLGGSGVVAGTGWNMAAGDVSPPIAVASLALIYAVADVDNQTLEVILMS